MSELITYPRVYNNVGLLYPAYDVCFPGRHAILVDVTIEDVLDLIHLYDRAGGDNEPVRVAVDNTSLVDLDQPALQGLDVAGIPLASYLFEQRRSAILHPDRIGRLRVRKTRVPVTWNWTPRMGCMHWRFEYAGKRVTTYPMCDGDLHIAAWLLGSRAYECGADASRVLAEAYPVFLSGFINEGPDLVGAPVTDRGLRFGATRGVLADLLAWWDDEAREILALNLAKFDCVAPRAV